MNKALFLIAPCAIVLCAAMPALAQPHGASDPVASGQMGTSNMNNPQAQTNENMQPSNAHRVESGPGLSSAPAIPTPTLGNQMTPTPMAKPQ